MLKSSPSPLADQLGRSLAENFQLRSQLRELGDELNAMRAQLEGDIPKATTWLQVKVWRQRRALDLLNRKNTSLRFALRLMNSIRPEVTAAEWKQARETMIAAEGYHDRLSETPPAVG